MRGKVHGSILDVTKRYSSSECVPFQNIISVSSIEEYLNSSFVECQNLWMRMYLRRFTCLTNVFPKKIDNHERAITFHFMHYNFVKHTNIKNYPTYSCWS